MKVRLLRRWNRLMDGVYAFDAVWNMSVPQRLFYAWLRLTGIIRLGHAAVAEFNEHYAVYHHLGYTVGPRVLVWRLHRRGKEMHGGRENAWSWFSKKYRRHSKRWNSPDAVLRRAVDGLDE